MKQKTLCFFIGTEAELIKVFPVIREVKKRGLPHCLIASGQNDILSSTVLRDADVGPVTVALSEEKSIRKSAVGLFTWMVRTYRNAGKTIAAALPEVDLPGSVMIVHGDTVSTLMGARIGKKLGMQVAHIEAGLRSHNLLNPFPEELDRIFTSACAKISFAPGAEACANLNARKTHIVDTRYNTVLDSLAFSRTLPCADAKINTLLESRYFVFVLHRQENLARKELVKRVVCEVRKAAQTMRCVCILHKPTELAFAGLGLLEPLQNDPNIVLLARRQYFDFMKLLDHAEYVITDGGSNQEELSYMGKPCLILRTHTERAEGLGENALLYGGEPAKIATFSADYTGYRRAPLQAEFCPSAVIADALSTLCR